MARIPTKSRLVILIFLFLSDIFIVVNTTYTYNNAPWNELYSNVATILDQNKIELDGIFFVNTPQSCVYISSDKKNIFDHPASYYSKTATRKVLFEKTNYKYVVRNFSTHTSISKQDGVLTLEAKYIAANTYKVNQRDNENVFTALKKMLEPIKRNFAVFLYVHDNIFTVLEQTNTIRFSIIELTV